MDVPATNVVFPYPQICILPTSNYGLDFEFPDEFFDAFEWSVVQSNDLQGFLELPEATFTPLGGNVYRVDVGVAASNLARNFFRIGFRLK